MSSIYWSTIKRSIRLKECAIGTQRARQPQEEWGCGNGSHVLKKRMCKGTPSMSTIAQHPSSTRTNIDARTRWNMPEWTQQVAALCRWAIGYSDLLLAWMA